MKIKFIALSLCVLASVNMVKGQESGKGFMKSENKHEIRLSVSDGLTQGTVDVLGMGLSDALLGTKRTDERFSMVYGLGYRYSLNRFRVGADLGFSMGSDKLMLAGDKSSSLKEKRPEPPGAAHSRIYLLQARADRTVRRRFGRCQAEPSHRNGSYRCRKESGQESRSVHIVCLSGQSDRFTSRKQPHRRIPRSRIGS